MTTRRDPPAPWFTITAIQAGQFRWYRWRWAVGLADRNLPWDTVAGGYQGA